MFKHESLAELGESVLVERLLTDPSWKSCITDIDGFPDVADYFTTVPYDGLPGAPTGDIDILVVPDDNPEQSIAIQAKRVKVGESAFSTGEPNKLKEVQKLQTQARITADIGFSQTYCYLFVLVDSRANNGGGFKFDGLTTPLQFRIESIDLLAGLDARVGAMRFELVQPLDDRPLGQGTFHARLFRLAQRQVQSPEVTEWVVKTKRRRLRVA